MSRSSTATPPAPFFPPRIATPTMKHAAPAPFSRTQANHFKRKAKQAFRRSESDHSVNSKTSLSETLVEPAENALDMSFEDVAAEETNDGPIFRTESVASVSTSASVDSSMTSNSAADSARRSSFAPSLCTSASSFVITPLATPASSRAPSLIQTDCSMDSTLPSPVEPEIDVPVKGSWVPNFGKMAKAVVHHGMNISPFGERRSKKVSNPVKIATVPEAAVFTPEVHIPQPSREELERLDEEAALARRREWAYEQQRRVQECARLCSQWPQSGYNQMKHGPYGSGQFYEPQSYCNPKHVATVMQRQAELERKMCEESALFFSCRRGSSNSSTSSASASSTSSPSLDGSDHLSADLSDAISSSLLSDDSTPRKSVTGKRSLSDLQSLNMDVDSEPTTPTPRQIRPLSCCGFKRPLSTTVTEEDKRRRVDEAMVVEEAVDTGVIQLPQPRMGRQLSASTPNLTANVTTHPAVYGQVVKTSDTHPILVSPLLPHELIGIISQNVTLPRRAYPPHAPKLSVLESSVDVPSLLLSFMPPQVQGQVAPTLPAAPAPTETRAQIGNMYLSSCPGKRLRLDGGKSARGPVCRDLGADLRRIKGEGIGCLVCCLDNNELALLGVPWESYSAVAAEVGLDVVRLPMPDGFTPVSLSLFDAQVTMIAEKYSLQGINVLVHCRGGVGRAGMTASAWAVKMGFVTPHATLSMIQDAATSNLSPAEAAAKASAPGTYLPADLEHRIVMSMVERVIAMIRSRRGLKAIESFEQVQFLVAYVKWLRSGGRL